MKHHDWRTYFALRRSTVDALRAVDLVNILRYEAARPLANPPDGWYAFEKASDGAVIVKRLASFGIRSPIVCTREDANDARGSCPSGLRGAVEKLEKDVGRES